MFSNLEIKSINPILIVEDDPESQKAIERTLKNEGLKVIAAKTGKEGIKLAKKEKPIIILLDVLLPDINGFETCKILKNNPDTRDIPVIFLSGLSDYTDKIKGFEIGGIDYITKPFMKNELLYRVKTYIELQISKKEILDSKDRFYQLIENMSSGVEVYEAAGDADDFIIKLMNNSAEKINNVKKENVIGKKIYEIFPWIYNSYLKEVLTNVYHTGKAEKLTAYNYKINNKSLYRDLYLYKLKTSEIVSIYDDVTYQKTAEIKIKESENRYKSLFNNNCAVMLLMNPETGKIIDANKAACKYYGYSLQEFKTKKIKDINIIDKDKTFSMINSTESFKENHFFLNHRLSNGEIRFVEVYTGPINLHGKKLIYSIIHDITERYKIQQAVKENEEKYKTVIDFTYDWEYWLNPEKKIIYISPSCERISGYAQSDFYEIPDLIEKIIHPHDLTYFKNQIKKFLGSERTPSKEIESEFRINRKDGAVRWIRSISRLIFNESDEYLGIRVSNSDITDRKNAEDNLKSSEKFLQQVFDAIQDAISVLDLDLNIIKINNAMEKRFSSKLPLLGKKCYEAYYGNKNECEYCPTKKAIRDKKPQMAVIASSGIEDKLGWRELYSFPIINSIGEVTGVIEYIRDISARKKAENELEEEKERLLVTLRSIGDAVITTDVNSNIMLMNNIAENLTGWTMLKAAGKKLTDILNIINENSNKKHENPVDIIIQTRNIVNIDANTSLLSNDGSKKMISYNGAPIRDKKGNIIGTVLVFRDITEKKMIEVSLQNTQKLESLGVLAGGIAHDFNNLLSGLFGYIDLARISIFHDKEALDYLDKAFNIFSRAKNLTQQLLTFSKGGSPIKKTINLKPLIHNSIQFVLTGSNVTATYKIPDNLWPCDIDENQISQVLDNIVINSRQAMPLGGTINISAQNFIPGPKLQHLLQKKQYVKISIKDQGTGISKEHLMRIFDPFFTTKQQGSGLGLTVAYSIIKKHEGHIEVESEIEKGSLFNIYLPASDNIIKLDTIENKAQFTGKGKILIIDDEEFINDIARKMLEKIGFKVKCVRSINQAMEQYKNAFDESKVFDLVILDLTMPGEIEPVMIIKKLKKIDENVKVIASSGYSEDPIIANPKKFGFIGRLIKPYSLAEISKTLSEIF